MTISRDAHIDAAAVADWMERVGLGGGSLEQVEPLAGGTQNIMVSFMQDGRRYILRRGPRHLRPGSNRIMGREIALLGGLAQTDVPHARLIASCEDESVLGGAVFYLMEPIDGYNALVSLPQHHAAVPEMRHRMGLSMVERLRRSAGSTTTPWGFRSTRGPTDSSSDRCRGGSVSSTPTLSSRAIQVLTLAMSPVSLNGWTGTDHAPGLPASCTAISTSPT